MLIEKLLVSKSFLIRNKSYFLQKGYKVDELIKNISKEDVNKNLIEINTKDLSIGSRVEVYYTCDYCNSNIILHTDYKTYLNRRKIIEKDACASCAVLKAKESTIKKYTEEELQNKKQQKRNKLQQRNKNYSVEKKKEIQEKRKQTCNNIYGVDHPVKSEDVKNKIKDTCLNLFGVKNASQSEEIKNKKRQTYYNKTGYYNPQQNPVAMEEKNKNV